MDRRKMKNYVLHRALSELYHSDPSNQVYLVSLMLDLKNDDVPSKATMSRYYRLIQDMIYDVEQKLK